MAVNIRRGVALSTVLVLILGSSDSLAQSPGAEPPPPDVYTSDDGLLTIAVPPGAAPPGADIRAIYRTPEERPDELANVETRSGFYELLPASQEFSEPVTITREIVLEELGFDLTRDGVPMIPLALRTVDGTWQWLDEQVVQRDLDTGSVSVSGKTSHFSQVAGFGGTAFVLGSLEPDLRRASGAPFVYTVDLIQPAGLGAELRALVAIIADPDIAVAGAGDVVGTSGTLQIDCVRPGSTQFETTAWVDMIGQGLPFFEDLGLPPVMQDLHTSGTLTCAPPAVSEVRLGPKSIAGTGRWDTVLRSGVDYDAAISFIRDVAKGRYGRLQVRRNQDYRLVFVDASGFVVFVDTSGFFDELYLLRPGEKPRTMEGASIGGPEGFLPGHNRIKRGFERGVDGNQIIDDVLAGNRVSRSFLRQIGGKPGLLDFLHALNVRVKKTGGLLVQDILGLPSVAPIDSTADSREEPFTPASVGVVDQDEGLWYLVDPVLADLSGSNEVEQGDLSGTGRGQVTFNQKGGKVCFHLDLSDLQGTVTAAHIHQGAAGVDGPIVVDLDHAINGEAGCVDAPSELIDDILADLDEFYVNVHSDVFPAGAVRGQLGGGPRPPFVFGDPGDDPFLGDWDGDGVDTPGLYRPSDGKVYLRNSNTPGIADIEFFFGDPEDIPLIGDWDGDGDDTVSLYRPSEGKVFITNKLGSDDQRLGQAEIEFLFGEPGDDPFGADFDGDGKDSVGVKRGDTFWWRDSLDEGPFDNNGLRFGDLDDEPMFGDWDGDGIDTPGVYRPSTSTIFLRNIQSPGIADMEIFTDGFESGDTSAWSTSR